MTYLEKGPQTIHCKVIVKEDGLYKDIVVQDLTTNKFLIVTVFPNWQGYIPDIGDIGYMEFEYCIAGRTEWYDKSSGTFEVYKNNYFCFRQFIRENKIENKQITI